MLHPKEGLCAGKVLGEPCLQSGHKIVPEPRPERVQILVRVAETARPLATRPNPNPNPNPSLLVLLLGPLPSRNLKLAR